MTKLSRLALYAIILCLTYTSALTAGMIEQNHKNNTALLDSAKKYINRTQGIIFKVREIAVQSANGIYSAQERKKHQKKIKQYVEQAQQSLSYSLFNGKYLFHSKTPKGAESLNTTIFKTGPYSGFKTTFTTIETFLKNADTINTGTIKNAEKSLPIIDNMLERFASDLNRIKAAKERLKDEFRFQKAVIYGLSKNKTQNLNKQYKQSMQIVFLKMMMLSMTSANGIYSPTDRKLLNFRFNSLKSTLSSINHSMRKYRADKNIKGEIPNFIKFDLLQNGDISTIDNANKTLKLCLPGIKK